MLERSVGIKVDILRVENVTCDVLRVREILIVLLFCGLSLVLASLSAFQC